MTSPRCFFQTNNPLLNPTQSSRLLVMDTRSHQTCLSSKYICANNSYTERIIAAMISRLWKSDLTNSPLAWFHITPISVCFPCSSPNVGSSSWAVLHGMMTSGSTNGPLHLSSRAPAANRGCLSPLQAGRVMALSWTCLSTVWEDNRVSALGKGVKAAPLPCYSPNQRGNPHLCSPGGQSLRSFIFHFATLERFFQSSCPSSCGALGL